MSDFRCAVASLGRAEPVQGTASTVRGFVLLEHDGPWGVDALRDARLPTGLGERVAAAARAAGVRVLLARRPRRGARPASGGTGGRTGDRRADPVRVFAAYADPTRPRLESGTLSDPRELLDLDLAGLRAGRGVGLEASAETLLGVCTQGRHDACCAELGRPVALALAESHPGQTWEVSHIGGDRFAGNLLVLPHGLYYGRLDPAAASVVADRHLAGELDLAHLRGRSGFAMPVQAAEIALRRHLSEVREGVLRLRERSVEGELTRVVFEVAGASYVVRIRSAPGPETHRLTCRATRESRIPEHEVLEIRSGI